MAISEAVLLASDAVHRRVAGVRQRAAGPAGWSCARRPGTTRAPGLSLGDGAELGGEPGADGEPGPEGDRGLSGPGATVGRGRRGGCAGRYWLSHPARRHGRVLRQRGAAGPAGAGGRPGHRGRRRPRAWCCRRPTRPALRRPLGHADGPGPAAVPAGGVMPPSRGPLRRGVQGGHGGVPGRSPRRSSRSPSTRRSLTCPARVRRLGRPAQIGELIRAQVRGAAGDHLLGRGGDHASSSPSWPRSRAKPDGLLVIPAERVARFPAPAAGVARCGGWGSRPGDGWPGSGCARSPTSRTRRGRAGARTRPGGRRAPARPGLGPGRALGGARGDGEEHRRRGDVRHRHRRPRGHPARAAAAVRADRARLRSPGVVGPDRGDQAQAGRLHHDHPVPHAARADRRGPADLYAPRARCTRRPGCPARARLRLVGVRASGLLPAATAQAQLAFGDRPTAWREAEQAIDQIAGRFGLDTVRPAALVRGRKPPR